MYDIHTHLYWEDYDKDRAEVLRRAKTAGVERMFVVGCTLEESQKALELAKKHPELFASVGVHPHEFNEEKDLETMTERMAELQKLGSDPKVVAIGECGLDYYVRSAKDDGKQVFIGRTSTVFNEEKKTIQKEGFRHQIDIAGALGKPMIVHCRDAYEDLFDIVSGRKTEIKAFILHCYMGDTEITKKFLEIENVYFSFTGNITYPTKKTVLGTKDDLAETVKLIPLNRIFTETDCPFLSPQQHRGDRNEPAYVAEVLEKIAYLKGSRVSDIESVIVESAQKVFDLT